jgi:uncharacterized protein YycO
MALLPGDVGLSADSDLIDKAIRAAEAVRYGFNSEEARWNHAWMIVDHQGGLVEARSSGVARGSFDQEYRNRERVVLRPNYPEGGADRAAAAMVKMVGEKYDWLEIVSVAAALLTGTHIRFGTSGRAICSGAVSRAVVAGGVDMGEDSNWNTPADIMHIASTQKWQTVAI